jgi:hypothetical protein
MKKICKCGKSSVDFEPAGEDWFTAITENITTKRLEHDLKFYCKNCNSLVDFADPLMITNAKGLLEASNSFYELTEWIVKNKYSVFLEADIPKESKKKILNTLNYSSDSLG